MGRTVRHRLQLLLILLLLCGPLVGSHPRFADRYVVVVAVYYHRTSCGIRLLYAVARTRQRHRLQRAWLTWAHETRTYALTMKSRLSGMLHFWRATRYVCFCVGLPLPHARTVRVSVS